MEQNDNEAVTSGLANLLSETSAAHATYEEEALGGKRDDDWPKWYAPYMREHGVAMLVSGPGANGVTADLESLLSQADESYTASAKTEAWPTYYARYLLDRAR